MATLHLLYSIESLNDCQKALSSDDAILLLQEGVYLLANNCPLPISIECYALQADIDARGITLAHTKKNNLSIIDDATFVDLVMQFTNNISWL